jgi:hypothetical protein
VLPDTCKTYSRICQYYLAPPHKREHQQNGDGSAPDCPDGQLRLPDNQQHDINDPTTIGWTSLQERRAQIKAVMMYRVVNHLIFIPADSIPVPTISPRDNNISFLVPHATTTVYQAAFFPDTIRIWNTLPSEVVTAPSLDYFKLQMQAMAIRP